MHKMFQAWYRATRKRLKRGWVWFVISPVLAFVWQLFYARVLDRINKAVDENAASRWLQIVSTFAGVIKNPITVAVIAFLVVLLVLIVHAYFDTRKKSAPDFNSFLASTMERFRTRIAEDVTKRTEEQRVQDRRILENAPHVDAIYDLPKLDHVGVAWMLRHMKLELANSKDSIAYNVQIQPKESARYKATFERIPRIAKGEPKKVEVDIRKKSNGTYFGEFEALLKFEYEDQPSSPNLNVHIPLTIQFEDSDRNLFEVQHEVIYNSFWCDARVHLLSGTRWIRQAAS